MADAELPFGDTVPTGTYLDMTANLPVVDPAKVHAPVLLVRGEYDGIATEEDLVAFFRKLANRDKQLVVLPGMSHALAFGYNREQLWHVMRSFLDMPSRRDHLGQLSCQLHLSVGRRAIERSQPVSRFLVILVTRHSEGSR